MQTPMNRKSATRLLLVQWSKFQNVSVKLEGSTLFTGINGSGKSTILDAVTYLITGNTQFNKAAKDRDRTVLGYVRGDTKSNGAARYLRSGEVISYIAMEFDDPVAGAPLVVGVCIESPNETAKPASSWFVLPRTTMDQINFTRREGNTLWITPKNELTVRGERLKGNAFLGRERGTEQVIRTLGLRCGVSKYRGKLLKMMAFHPENNIDQFIQECVLEPGKIESLSELREQRQQFDRLQDVYVRLSEGKTQLEVIEKRSQDYEKKKRTLHIREMLFCYQDLQMLENEEKEVESQRTVLEEQLKDLGKTPVRAGTVSEGRPGASPYRGKQHGFSGYEGDHGFPAAPDRRGQCGKPCLGAPPQRTGDSGRKDQRAWHPSPKRSACG